MKLILGWSCGCLGGFLVTVFVVVDVLLVVVFVDVDVLVFRRFGVGVCDV